MYISKCFKLFDTVRFHSTDSNLDGICGKILNEYNENYNPIYPPPYHYIVLLDEKYLGQMAINITEACLELVE